MNTQILDVRSDPLETVLTITDERVDLSRADELKRSLEAVANETGTDIAIDMGRVTFIDSSGLSALVALYKHLGTGRRLHLRNVAPNVKKLFSATKLDRVVTIR